MSSYWWWTEQRLASSDVSEDEVSFGVEGNQLWVQAQDAEGRLRYGLIVEVRTIFDLIST